MLMNPKITDTNPHVYFLKVFRQYIDNIGYSVMTQLAIDSGLSVGFISMVYHGKKGAGFDSQAAFALAMGFGSHEEMIAYGKTIDQTTHQVVPKDIGNKPTEKEEPELNQKELLKMLLEERARRAVVEDQLVRAEEQNVKLKQRKAELKNENEDLKNNNISELIKNIMINTKPPEGIEERRACAAQISEIFNKCQSI